MFRPQRSTGGKNNKSASKQITNKQEETINKWIESLSPISFINKAHRRYIDPSIMSKLPLLKYNKNQWHKLFTPPPNDAYEKLQLTHVGTYSIGQPDITKELIEFVKKMINEEKLDANSVSITETNGGLGGFTIALLREFNIVNITELNPTHFTIIKNNLEVYGFGKDSNKKITIYNDDYLNVMLDIEQDIIISDPPWGGRNYLKIPALKLGFSNINIVEIINYLNKNKRFRLFIFLAPSNFDFNQFMQNINTKEVKIYKVRAHNFVCVASRA